MPFAAFLAPAALPRLRATPPSRPTARRSAARASASPRRQQRLLPPSPRSPPPARCPAPPPAAPRALPHLVLRLLPLLPLLRAVPAVASSLSSAVALPALDPASFVSGLTASFLLVLASELGDKTFFISALLSMKYSRFLVLVGTMLALGAMTVISVAIGQLFHALPTSLNSTVPFDDYAAVALLLWFGYQNIRDGLQMSNQDEEELQDAKDVVAGKAKTTARGARVVAETSSLIFLAEWGDKSMLATVALAAAKSPIGVIVGGISGHFVASVIAVLGGSFLGRFLSERNARLIGGILFFVFAVLTVFGIY